MDSAAVDFPTEDIPDIITEIFLFRLFNPPSPKPRFDNVWNDGYFSELTLIEKRWNA